MRFAGVLVVATVAVQALFTTPTVSARLDIAPLSDSEAAQRLDKATVELLVLGCDLSLRQGTAVALNRGTYGSALVTNQHVIGTFRSLDVSEDGFRPAAASSAAVLPGADVAVVTAGGLGLAPLELSPDDPRPGDPVRFAGYPHDAATPSLPDGLVIDSARVIDYVSSPSPSPSPSPAPVMRVMRLNAQAVPGMSGGPVLDRGGRLAGLVFGVQSPTDDTLAVPVSVLRRLLAGPSSPPGRC